MGSAGLTCAKYITFFCNLLFACTGILIFCAGLFIQLKYSHFSNFVSKDIWTVPIILMIVGAVVAIICFLGCCGSIKEKSCMMMTFAILGVIILLSELILGILAFYKLGDLKQLMETQFNTTITEYNERDDYRDAWRLLQTELKCCGTYGPTDWESIYNNKTLPASCCEVINLNEAVDCTVLHSHQEGCLNKTLAYLSSNTTVFVAVIFSVFGVQLLAILFACCLYRSFRRDYQSV